MHNLNVIFAELTSLTLLGRECTGLGTDTKPASIFVRLVPGWSDERRSLLHPPLTIHPIDSNTNEAHSYSHKAVISLYCSCLVLCRQ